MTLTVGDMAALTGVFSVLTGALTVAIRYFVKAEIREAVGALKLELATERATVLAKATAQLLQDARSTQED